MRVDSSDRDFVSFFVASVCFRGQFDHGVQGDLDVGKIFLWEIVKICVSAVVGDDQETAGELTKISIGVGELTNNEARPVSTMKGLIRLSDVYIRRKKTR